MKKDELLSTLNESEMRKTNGGFHIHVIQPEPGTCSCTPISDKQFDITIFFPPHIH